VNTYEVQVDTDKARKGLTTQGLSGCLLGGAAYGLWRMAGDGLLGYGMQVLGVYAAIISLLMLVSVIAMASRITQLVVRYRIEADGVSLIHGTGTVQKIPYARYLGWTTRRFPRSIVLVPFPRQIRRSAHVQMSTKSVVIDGNTTNLVDIQRGLSTVPHFHHVGRRFVVTAMRLMLIPCCAIILWSLGAALDAWLPGLRHTQYPVTLVVGLSLFLAVVALGVMVDSMLFRHSWRVLPSPTMSSSTKQDS
jgi:hypothetical protein